DGDSAGSQVGDSAASVSLTSADTSRIDAVAAAVSVAFAFGGTAGVGFSLGVSIAQNTITSQVASYIANANSVNATPYVYGVGRPGSGGLIVRATEGATINAISAAASLAAGLSGLVGVAVSGAGADANNTILTGTNAYVQASAVHSGGTVDIQALN